MSPTETTSAVERPLPTHDSDEVAQLFSDRETIEAARFLLERRSNPPTMAEWIERSQTIFGKTNAQTQRRLRAVRTKFIVESRRRDRDFVYVITGWNPAPSADRGERISPRLQAEVYTVNGRFCAMCGRGPRDGVRLQVDHKVPRSWGGETEISNLEPLCAEHNNGKKAFFHSLDQYGPKIRDVLDLPTPWERIGELLKLLGNDRQQMPSELLSVVARETHVGDPARRLRDLRVVLGWKIIAHKRKDGRRTRVAYELVSWEPWPSEGAHEAVRRYERDRKRRKA